MRTLDDSHEFAYGAGVRFNRDSTVEIIERSNYPSRKAFADAVKVSPGTLHDILSSKPRRQPSDDLIRRIASELKVPITAIIHAPEEEVA